MKNYIGKIDYKLYFMIISVTGVLSFLWLLLLPSDRKLWEAIAKNVTCTRELLILELMDGRTVSTPFRWIPRLETSSEDQLLNWELTNSGLTLHWPGLEIKIRVEQLLSGNFSIENRAFIDQWWKK